VALESLDDVGFPSGQNGLDRRSSRAVATATPATLDRIRRISIISPMRNEADHVEGLIADIADQDFDGEIKVFIADGRSTDDSIDRAKRAAEEHGVALTILDNPDKWVSSGLNACIRHSDGELLVRLDCHSRYPRNYVRRCALVSEETGADVVGGIFVPRGRTRHERAVACAMDSPFGGVHWARNSSQGVRRDADIAVYGAFKPRAFEFAGFFDESLMRNQDDEFTLRLRRLGGRVVLDSSIHVYYTPRSTLRGVFRQYFQYGFWKVPVMLRYHRASSLRSLAPIAFIGTVVLAGALAPLFAAARWLLLAECCSYGFASVVFGIRAVRNSGERMSILPRVLAVFLTFHVSYGSGMVAGFANAFRGRRDGLR
jgi:succinoglycan biosynthesis protein ExoA